jgi:hypothetical protein
MSESDVPGPAACCESRAACVFAKALLARTAVCELASRRSVGERELLECSSVVARTNCATLAALMHERARFALHLPSAAQPMIHAQALRLHCGGLIGLQHALGAAKPDVHVMVGAAHERFGSLTALPWDAIVRDLADWAPRSRRKPALP